jgi:hypothetical protein
MVQKGIAHATGESKMYRLGRKELPLMIQTGEQAPDFTLESTQGSFTLSSLKGEKNVVLIFYPKNNTPG